MEDAFGKNNKANKRKSIVCEKRESLLRLHGALWDTEFILIVLFCVFVCVDIYMYIYMTSIYGVVVNKIKQPVCEEEEQNVPAHGPIMSEICGIIPDASTLR